jgi:hypothetical protein
MKEEKNIEQLFKDAFSNFEAPVDPQLWSGIEQAVSSAPASSGTVSSVSSLFKIAATTIGVATLIATSFYFYHKTEHKPQTLSPQTPQELPLTVQPGNVDQEQNSKNNTVVNKVTTTASNRHKEPIKEELKINTPLVSEEPLTEAPKSMAPVAVEPIIPVVGNEQELKSNVSTPTVETNNEPAVAKETEANPGKANNPYQSLPGMTNMVFTPNNDGIGDYFEFDDSQLLSVSVKIYSSKNYKLIYEWNNPGGRWDGNLTNGSAADEGIYIVMIQAKGADGTNYRNTIKLQLRRN